MIEQSAQHCDYLQFENLSRVHEVAHAVFTRRGGFSAPPYRGLNVAFATGDDPATVRRNGAAVRSALSLPTVSARTVHGDSVTFITRADVDAARQAAAEQETSWTSVLAERVRQVRADAMITDVPGIALFWGYGDCTPILLFDPHHHAVALVHAGWRGTAKTVVVKAVVAMRDHFGTRANEVLVGIGPAIGACCYEARQEILDAFATEPFARETVAFEEHPASDGGGSRLMLDVARSNVRQLLATGVRQANIEESGYCTGCHTDLFYSHRREGEPSGRFGVAIGLRGNA